METKVKDTIKICEKRTQEFIDETGKTFGRLTVIERIYMKSKPKRSRAVFRCQCSCGNYISMSGWLLRKGTIKECGVCAQVWEKKDD